MAAVVGVRALSVYLPTVLSWPVSRYVGFTPPWSVTECMFRAAHGLTLAADTPDPSVTVDNNPHSVTLCGSRENPHFETRSCLAGYTIHTMQVSAASGSVVRRRLHPADE